MRLAAPYDHARVGIYFVAQSGRVSPVLFAGRRTTFSDIGILDALRNHDPSKAKPAGSPGNPRESRYAQFDEPLRQLLAQHTLHGLTVAKACREIEAPAQYAGRVKAGKVVGVVVERGRVKLADSQERAA